MTKSYIGSIQDAILRTHGCVASYLESVPVKEVFQGRVAWEGDVEVFSVEHPKAKLCYAWGFKDDAGQWQYVAVLNTPPVDSPKRAVQAYIFTQVKKSH